MNSFLFAQEVYWVEFKDKGQSEFSLNNPSEFLSENALNRRAYFSIPLSESDLPVSSNYIEQVKALDASTNKISKWLNGALFASSNLNFISEVNNLSFVKKVTIISLAQTKELKDKFQMEETSVDLASDLKDKKYGSSTIQMNMLQGEFLHDLGFQASTIDIGVMDNGFHNVNTNKYFTIANSENRIHSAYNFVENQPNVFGNGSHGAYVMSTLASYVEDTLIGTAPEGNFYLFVTEDQNSEGIPEEINWALAAEYADSALGIWTVLTTSLGYSNGFSDPTTNYSYGDMDGNTTIITRAADLAAQKGMLVVNSAGNEGLSDWYHITAPGDGDSVMTIGAVSGDEGIVEFSSFGPSVDGRIKPNVSALGRGVVATDVNEVLKSISGTSFSCPITAGLTACLWQAFPEKNNMEIIAAIEQSAHLFYDPEDQMGYGIPNFEKAYLILTLSSSIPNVLGLNIVPNPVEEELNLSFINGTSERYKVIISDMNGKIWYQNSNKPNTYEDVIGVESLPNGVYTIFVQQGKFKTSKKFVKN